MKLYCSNVLLEPSFNLIPFLEVMGIVGIPLPLLKNVSYNAQNLFLYVAVFCISYFIVALAFLFV